MESLPRERYQTKTDHRVFFFFFLALKECNKYPFNHSFGQRPRDQVISYMKINKMFWWLIVALVKMLIYFYLVLMTETLSVKPGLMDLVYRFFPIHSISLMHSTLQLLRCVFQPNWIVADSCALHCANRPSWSPLHIMKHKTQSPTLNTIWVNYT